MVEIVWFGLEMRSFIYLFNMSNFNRMIYAISQMSYPLSETETMS